MSDATLIDVPIQRPLTLGRFLHTHNPFYLISCFLIIYGLQDWARASTSNLGGGFALADDAVGKAARMFGGMAAYSIVMVATCISVVRLGKIWEDARSIFLVVLISMVALSSSFDEVCISEWEPAVWFACVGLLLVVSLSEAMIRSCGLRLSGWYRLALYAILAVFFAVPPVLGYCVIHRHDQLANAGSVYFSMAVGSAMLVLVPAVRQGHRGVRRNGTPWKWPLFPLTAFGILIVLAAIRTHAIWMSFGFHGRQVRFEPMLLVPMLAATIVLIAEAGLGQRKTWLTQVAAFASPSLLVCGLSGGGMTYLPIRHDCAIYFGSGWTVAIMTVAGLYLYMTLRGVSGAAFGLTGMLLLAGFTAPLPILAKSYGLESWMFVAVSGLILLLITLRRMDADWLWSAIAAIATVSMVMASRTYGWQPTGFIVAATFAVVSMMAIGLFFRTELALFLRTIAASVFVTGCVYAAYLFALRDERVLPIVGLVAGSVVSLLYANLVRRKGWFTVSAVQILVLVGLMSYDGYSTGKLSQVNWPISGGIVCFLVGVVITSSKTAQFAKARERHKTETSETVSAYLSGL